MATDLKQTQLKWKQRVSWWWEGEYWSSLLSVQSPKKKKKGKVGHSRWICEMFKRSEMQTSPCVAQRFEQAINTVRAGGSNPTRTTHAESTCTRGAVNEALWVWMCPPNGKCYETLLLWRTTRGRPTAAATVLRSQLLQSWMFTYWCMNTTLQSSSLHIYHCVGRICHQTAQEQITTDSSGLHSGLIHIRIQETDWKHQHVTTCNTKTQITYKF